jgi:hypothetical protein
MSALDVLRPVRDSVFTFGGSSYAFVPGTPLRTPEIEAIKEKACPRLGEDYLEFVATYGYANVFGAQLEAPIAVTRYDQKDVKATAHAFTQFARRAPLLFAFYAPVPDGLVGLSKREAWPATSAVVMMKAERLAGDLEYTTMAESFTAWLSFVIEMCRQRAATG